MNMESKDKRTFFDSVKNCIDGINFVLANEKNFVREIIMAMIAISCGYFLNISRIEYIIILLVICFVLVLELINTALEKVVDLYTTKYNTLAKTVKDVSAAAVFVMSIFAFIIGVIIFLPKIIDLINRV